jgi:hypothetical protein
MASVLRLKMIFFTILHFNYLNLGKKEIFALKFPNQGLSKCLKLANQNKPQQQQQMFTFDWIIVWMGTDMVIFQLF